MTKEEYLIDREKKSINIEAAYYMYMNKNTDKAKIGLEQFSMLLRMWMGRGPTMEKYFQYYDETFKIEKGHE